MAKEQDRARSAYLPDDESKINEALVESFPASDAPSWTLGVSTSPRRRDIIDVSSPSRPAAAWRPFPAWIEAALLAMALGLAIAAAGAVVGLVIRLLVDTVAWFVGRL